MLLGGCDFFGTQGDDDDSVPDWTDPDDELVLVSTTYTTPIVCEDSPLLFQDVTEAAGVGFTPANPPWDDTANGYSSLDVELIGGFVVAEFIPGRLDLVVTDADASVRHFADVTGDDAAGVGLPLELLLDAAFTVGASAADYDGDRDPDLLLLRRGPDLLLENRGGLFYPTGLLEGPDARSMSAAWADVDQDGDLDVYVARHGAGAILPDVIYDPDRDSLFLQQEDGSFVDVIDAVLPVEDDGHGYVAGWLDADRDGWLDLYVVNDLGAEPENPPSIFLRGTGDPERPLEHAPEALLDLPMYGMGLAIADYDNDGDEDVHVTDIGGTFLGRNDAGTFTDLSLQLDGLNNDPAADIAWGTEWLDIDNDGFLELFSAFGYMPSKPNGAPGGAANAVEQADGLWFPALPTDQWFPAGVGLGIGNVAPTRTAVSADLNRDGFPEMITWGLDQGLRLHRGYCTENAWLRVVLDQPGTNNRHAIGAWVQASANGSCITSRRVRAGTSLSSGLPEVILGLGEDEVVDLRIEWPDQAVSIVEGLPTRRTVTITR